MRAGAFGSSLDYLERTRVALVTHGIVDPYLEALAAKVAALRARPSRRAASRASHAAVEQRVNQRIRVAVATSRRAGRRRR